MAFSLSGRNRQPVDASYREIAEQTGIALGAAGKVLKSFAAAGFLTDRGKVESARLLIATSYWIAGTKLTLKLAIRFCTMVMKPQMRQKKMQKISRIYLRPMKTYPLFQISYTANQYS
ncbi:MAG: hypothetical protein WA987_07640 [Cellvibrio sp.]